VTGRGANYGNGDGGSRPEGQAHWWTGKSMTNGNGGAGNRPGGQQHWWHLV
jgi:hypothetical protein